MYVCMYSFPLRNSTLHWVIFYSLLGNRSSERSHRKGDIRRVIVPVDSVQIYHATHRHSVRVPVGVHTRVLVKSIVSTAGWSTIVPTRKGGAESWGGLKFHRTSMGDHDWKKTEGLLPVLRAASESELARVSLNWSRAPRATGYWDPPARQLSTFRHLFCFIVRDDIVILCCIIF